jgi:hypothetical protein
MTSLSLRRIGAFTAVSFLTLLVLTACSNTGNQNQANAEAYIRANVNNLSPTPAVLGGTFVVTDIEWEDDTTAIVSYEDGHIAMKGRATVLYDAQASDDYGFKISTFEIIDGDGGTSASGSVVVTGSGSASSVVERPRSKEGETCGGIAGLQCDFGLICIYDGAYPDAAGKCSK